MQLSRTRDLYSSLYILLISISIIKHIFNLPLSWHAILLTDYEVTSISFLDNFMDIVAQWNFEELDY